MNYVEADDKHDPAVVRPNPTGVVCTGNIVMYAQVLPEHRVNEGRKALDPVFAKMFKWFEKILDNTPPERLETLTFNFAMTLEGPEDRPKITEKPAEKPTEQKYGEGQYGAVDPAENADDPGMN